MSCLSKYRLGFGSCDQESKIYVPGKYKRRKFTKLLEQVPGDIDQLTACLPSTEEVVGSITSTACDPSPQVVEAVDQILKITDDYTTTTRLDASLGDMISIILLISLVIFNHIMEKSLI